VDLSFADDEVVLKVSDDGVGFELEALPVLLQGTRFGLVGMRERAGLLGGSLHIKAAPGQGVTVTVTVPLAIAGGGVGE
jgi:two-component system sensor histidine kinase NreB